MAGISFAFFLLGLGLTALGAFFHDYQVWFARISGVIILLFGLYQLGLGKRAMLLEQEPEFRSLDTDRVLRMCLIHDLGEAFTGDIPAFSKSAQDEGREQGLYEDWIAQFPPANRAQFQALLAEMTALATPEAKLYKALDKLEAVIQHNEASLDSWLPLEYDLQRTYGQEAVQFSPYLRALKAEIDRWTEEKIAAAPPQAQRSEIRD